MDDTVKKTWTAINGNLVFEITILRSSEFRQSSSAQLYCRDNPENFHVIHIDISRRSDFNYRFNNGCYVNGYLRQQAHMQVDGVEHTGIFGDIRFGHAGKYDEQRFEGFLVTCPTDREQPSLPSTNPVDHASLPAHDLPVVNSSPGELFPYIYLRKWPTISAIDLRRGFIQYVQYLDGSPPASVFYDDLCAARQSGRSSVENLALNFIDGAAPYQGEFLSDVDLLAGSISCLPIIAARCSEIEGDPKLLVTEIAAIFQVDNPQEVRTILVSTEYRNALDRVWQSYFALVITLGYDSFLHAALIRLLITGHILDILFVEYAEPQTVTRELLRELSTATIVLPKALFPLPPCTTSPPSMSPPPADGNWIEPYAIGELQMVRQRLLRYELGEIARIENIMRGERKEIGRKRIHRQVDFQASKTENFGDLENEAADQRNDLMEETRKAIAEKTVTNKYQNFTTTYGPPTEATLDGTWSEFLQQGKNPGADDATRFARDILNKTISRVGRKVSLERSSSVLDESEDTVKSTIDNSSGDRNLVCMFRWLNKVYEAHVVNYGNRLMIEFMLRDPAAYFIREQRQVNDENYAKPVSPLSRGITSFKSIEDENFAHLAAIYDATDIEPPPPARMFVSATLRSGAETQVAIPDGYCADDAFVTFIAPPGSPSGAAVMVGRETFNQGDSATVPRTFGEDTTMPISVGGCANSFSPPVSDMDIQVNVVIECKPTATWMDSWRIKTYHAIQAGYRKQLSHYDQIGGVLAHDRKPARSPLASREIERDQLKRGCAELLLEHLLRHAGLQDIRPQDSEPDEFSVDEPRYLQFFDELFEWNEMTYRFYADGGRKGLSHLDIGMGADAPLTAFLQSDSARVMVPVQPARYLAFLCFLSTGMVWEGDGRLAPICIDDVAVVNDIKRAEWHASTSCRQVGKPWEIIVPTSMQVIDAGTPDRLFESRKEA